MVYVALNYLHLKTNMKHFSKHTVETYCASDRRHILNRCSLTLTTNLSPLHAVCALIDQVTLCCLQGILPVTRPVWNEGVILIQGTDLNQLCQAITSSDFYLNDPSNVADLFIKRPVADIKPVQV